MFDPEQAPVMPKHQMRMKRKSKLPPGCARCGGRPWVPSGYAGSSVEPATVKRCICERGKALQALDVARATR